MRIIPRYNGSTGRFEIVKIVKEAITADNGETVEPPEFETVHEFPVEADHDIGNKKACAAFDYFKRTGEIPTAFKKPVL